MTLLLAALLTSLHFTAPADTLGRDAVDGVRMSTEPVHAYVFQRLDTSGRLVAVRGFADADGRALLRPHTPGTWETVWVERAPDGDRATFYVMSIDANGNLSGPSNGFVLPGAAAPGSVSARPAAWTSLDVPIVRQTRERCGQAALAMVLQFYGASPAALREVSGAYDPVLHGSLITDLAGAARRAGFQAEVVTLTPDSLIGLLNQGIPPILLYQSGTGPLTLRHFGVVTRWDVARGSFTLHDGTSRPRVTRREDLARRWQTAGSQALVVRQVQP